MSEQLVITLYIFDKSYTPFRLFTLVKQATYAEVEYEVFAPRTSRLQSEVVATSNMSEEHHNATLSLIS